MVCSLIACFDVLLSVPSVPFAPYYFFFSFFLRNKKALSTSVVIGLLCYVVRLEFPKIAWCRALPVVYTHTHIQRNYTS
jgi:hypothetical protein